MYFSLFSFVLGVYTVRNKLYHLQAITMLGTETHRLTHAQCTAYTLLEKVIQLPNVLCIDGVDVSFLAVRTETHCRTIPTTAYIVCAITL